MATTNGVILDYGGYGYGSWTPYTNFNLNAACYALPRMSYQRAVARSTPQPRTAAGGYHSGTVVQLTAIPNSGYAFASWSGDCH